MNKHKISGIIFLILVAVVVIGGIYYWQYGRVSNPVQNTPDETANWKTYTNSQYGFEFKYPKTWNYEITPLSTLPFRSINFYNPDEYDIYGNRTTILGINIYDNSNAVNVEDWVRKNKTGVIVSDLVATNISETPAVKFKESGLFVYSSTYIGKEKMIFNLIAPDADNNDEVYNQILSTFKFISNLDTIDYSKWLISKEALEESRPDFEIAEEDCPYLISDSMDYGGDLLSTLIADPEARKMMALKVYTQEYVKRLEQKIVAETHTRYNKDFYAFKVCHVGTNFDVVEGRLWPKNVSMTRPPFGGYEFGMGIDILVFVNDKKINIYEGFKLWNNSITGGWIIPCDTSLKDNAVVLKCLISINQNGMENPITDNIKSWTFPLNGGSPIVKEFVE